MERDDIKVSTNTEKRCLGPDEGEGDYDNTDVSRGQVGNDHRWRGQKQRDLTPSDAFCGTSLLQLQTPRALGSTVCQN